MTSPGPENCSAWASRSRSRSSASWVGGSSQSPASTVLLALNHSQYPRRTVPEADHWAAQVSTPRTATMLPAAANHFAKADG